MAWHSLMPNIDNDEDVFDSHSLQEGEKFLTASFFITVIVALGDIGRLFAITKLVLFVVIFGIIWTIGSWGNSISYNAAFCLGDASFASHIIEHQVHMGLITDCCWKGLKLGTSRCLLFSKTYRIEYTLHLFHHWHHFNWYLIRNSCCFRCSFVFSRTFDRLACILVIKWY